MKLPPHALSARSITAMGLMAALLTTAALIASASPEAVVSRSFAVALEDSATEVKEPRSYATISGTEEFWLSEQRRLAGEGSIEPAAWSSATPLLQLATGDRITFGSGAFERVLEVVSVAASGDSDTGRTLTISARDTSHPTAPLVILTTTFELSPKGGIKSARAL